ncbi:MAG TPA: DUF5681 domain-containing protein [Sphingomicrobium sp.]|jgi:hypothetical protein|nr:DUF5681 domain-containing protein [Sphingomicrobium sp.]
MAKRSPPPSAKVGPGKPPRSTQFKKGQSGNPGGRPRKERDFAKLVDNALDEVIAGTENGKPIKITRREYIVKRLVKEAADGNLKAIDRVISLVSTSAREVNGLVGIDPAVVASFLARHGNGSGESGAAA